MTKSFPAYGFHSSHGMFLELHTLSKLLEHSMQPQGGGHDRHDLSRSPQTHDRDSGALAVPMSPHWPYHSSTEGWHLRWDLCFHPLPPNNFKKRLKSFLTTSVTLSVSLVQSSGTVACEPNSLHLKLIDETTPHT